MNQLRQATESDTVALAFLLGRPSLSSKQWSIVEQRIQEVDTEELFDVTQRLGVDALVASHLTQRDEIPEKFAQRASSHRHSVTTRNLRLAGELTRVLSELESQQVDALPYKGPVLASLAYDDIACRSFSDLDFFIGQDSVPAACRVLESMGFERKEETHFTPTEIVQDEGVIRLPREFTFTKDDVVVEIRWQLGSEFRPFDFSFRDCWDRRIDEKVAGQSISTLSVEDTLLVLARHGAKHQWNRLGWVIDIAALVESTTVDWRTLIERANSLRVRRVLESGLLLASRLGDAKAPQWVLTSARDDICVNHTVSRTVNHLLDNPETAAFSRDRMRRHSFDLCLCDTWEDRLRFLVGTATKPQELDYNFLPLPKKLHRLYYGIRPIRMLFKAGNHASEVVRS